MEISSVVSADIVVLSSNCKDNAHSAIFHVLMSFLGIKKARDNLGLLDAFSILLQSESNRYTEWNTNCSSALFPWRHLR